MKINFSVLTEEFWRHTRPCYVKEVMKILNIVHAILLSAIEKHEAESVFAGKSYSQKQEGLNDPILKIMMLDYASLRGEIRSSSEHGS